VLKLPRLPKVRAGPAGVAVDPMSGDVSGRCETSFSLNADPAGKRLACFMLDGKCAWTGDGGQIWQAMASVGRNWDFAAVDWSTPDVKNIIAGLHESGGQVLTSVDGGKSWKKLFKDKEFDKSGGLGIFDARTLVYTQQGKGIQRSTDGGETWTKVSDLEPIGRVAQVLKGTAYWLGREGLLVSKDRGATWTVQGKPVAATIGPMIDPRNERSGIQGTWAKANRRANYCFSSSPTSNCCRSSAVSKRGWRRAASGSGSTGHMRA
jgi:hypothetical protein